MSFKKTNKIPIKKSCFCQCSFEYVFVAVSFGYVYIIRTSSQFSLSPLTLWQRSKWRKYTYVFRLLLAFCFFVNRIFVLRTQRFGKVSFVCVDNTYFSCHTPSPISWIRARWSSRIFYTIFFSICVFILFTSHFVNFFFSIFQNIHIFRHNKGYESI